MFKLLMFHHFHSRPANALDYPIILPKFYANSMVAETLLIIVLPFGSLNSLEKIQNVKVFPYMYFEPNGQSRILPFLGC